MIHAKPGCVGRLRRQSGIVLHTFCIYFDTWQVRFAPEIARIIGVENLANPSGIPFSARDLHGIYLAQTLLLIANRINHQKGRVAMKLINFFLVISVRLGAGSALVLLRNLWP